MAFDKKKWTKKYNKSAKAKKSQRAWYLRNIEKSRAKSRKYHKSAKGKAARKRYYDKNKKNKDFRLSQKKSRLKYYKKNKEKILNYQKEFRNKNKKLIAKRNKNWRINNKEKKKKIDQNYRIKNRKKLSAQKLLWAQKIGRKRRRNNPQTRMRDNLSKRLNKILKERKIIKSQKMQNLIGCSSKKLFEHLSKLFKPSMKWENYGKWHVDHIIPCSSFDLTNVKEQKICFNYKNLQPLWAIENLKKSDKILKN